MTGPSEPVPAHGFWDERFRREGHIWGDTPSVVAPAVARFFRAHDLRRVCIPGCAYGRHCLYFARLGFRVVGLDVAVAGLTMAARGARGAGMLVSLAGGDALQLPFRPGIFDGLFAFNLLHLFLAPDRARCLAEWFRVLRPGGWACFTAFATEDASCGKGRLVETNTFDDRGGRPAHYFTAEEVRDLCGATGFIPRGVETVREQENHGVGPHLHVWHLVTAQRSSPA